MPWKLLLLVIKRKTREDDTKCRDLLSLPSLLSGSHRVSFSIGTGTFGRVRLALYKPTKKYYAMKVMKKSLVIQLKQVDHVKNEKSILSQIDHPFVAHMLSYIPQLYSFSLVHRGHSCLKFFLGVDLFSLDFGIFPFFFFPTLCFYFLSQ